MEILLVITIAFSEASIQCGWQWKCSKMNRITTRITNAAEFASVLSTEEKSSLNIYAHFWISCKFSVWSCCTRSPGLLPCLSLKLAFAVALAVSCCATSPSAAQAWARPSPVAADLPEGRHAGAAEADELVMWPPAPVMELMWLAVDGRRTARRRSWRNPTAKL